MSWSVVAPLPRLIQKTPSLLGGLSKQGMFQHTSTPGLISFANIVSVFFLFFRETAPRQTARVFEAACAADMASGCTRQNLWHGVWRRRLLIKGSGLKGGGVAALSFLLPSSCDEEELNTNQMQRLKGTCIKMPQKHAGQHSKSFDTSSLFKLSEYKVI